MFAPSVACTTKLQSGVMDGDCKVTLPPTQHLELCIHILDQVWLDSISQTHAFGGGIAWVRSLRKMCLVKFGSWNTPTKLELQIYCFREVSNTSIRDNSSTKFSLQLITSFRKDKKNVLTGDGFFWLFLSNPISKVVKTKYSLLQLPIPQTTFISSHSAS